jgi:HD superfamily phosphodiesterase
MEPRVVEELQQFILSTTESAARKDWKASLLKHRKPLYNYRYDHVAEVARIARQLAETTEADMEVVTIASWLHDSAKPGIGGVKMHAEASAELAFSMLSDMGLEQDLIERVCDTIRKHAGLTLDKPIDPIEAQILWEADKIAKLGLVGFLHYVLNAVQMKPGQTLENLSSDVLGYLPLAEKIAASMSTERGKEIAAERLERLKMVAHALESELNTP